MRPPHLGDRASIILTIVSSRFQGTLNDENQREAIEDIRRSLQEIWRSGYCAGEQAGPRREDMGR